MATGCWVVGLPLYVYRPGQPPRRLLGDYGDEVVLFGMVAGPILLLLVGRLVVWAKNPPANETRGMRCIWNVSRFEAQSSPNINQTRCTAVKSTKSPPQDSAVEAAQDDLTDLLTAPALSS